MKSNILGRTAIPAAVALSLALTACGAANEGGDDNAGGSATTGGSSVSGSIAGAGASSQAAAVEAWKAGFEKANPEATVDYDPAGSGAGRKQFLSGGVAFAGSDAALKEEEIAKVSTACVGGELVEIPAYISPIAVAFNVEGVEELNLSPDTLARIFDQKIKKWDDAAIAKDNPNAKLPDLAITPVNRSDESGTTENFVEYLAAAAPTSWKHEVDGNWPVPGGEAAKGTSGVVGAIEAGNGTIGYADASQINELKAAKVKVGEEFVAYSPEAAAKVVDVSKRIDGRGQYDYAIELERDTKESGTYPVVLVSYTLACTKYDSAEKAELVKAWLTYITSEEGQKAAAENAGSAPISEAGRENATKAIEAISASS